MSENSKYILLCLKVKLTWAVWFVEIYNYITSEGHNWMDSSDGSGPCLWASRDVWFKTIVGPFIFPRNWNVSTFYSQLFSWDCLWQPFIPHNYVPILSPNVPQIKLVWLYFIINFSFLIYILEYSSLEQPIDEFYFN